MADEFRLHLEAEPSNYLEVKVDWAAGCDRAVYTCACGFVTENVAALVSHLQGPGHRAERILVNPEAGNGHG